MEVYSVTPLLSSWSTAGQEQHMVHEAHACTCVRACVCVLNSTCELCTHTKAKGIRLTAANAPGGIYLSQTIQSLLKVPD